MSYKTILVHFSTVKQAQELMNVACLLAKKYDAHIVGLFVIPEFHINPSVSVYVPVELMASHKKFHRNEAEKIKDSFEKYASAEDVSVEWRLLESSTPSITSVVIDQALRADLVITRQADDDGDDAYIKEVPAEVILGCGRPVLMVPNEGHFDTVGDYILIGWNGTREAARAAYDALPLLKDADKVSVHWVNTEGKNVDKTTLQGVDLAASLARHQVNVNVEMSEKAGVSVGKGLLAHAAEQGADLVVMGGYGHSRTREFIFGGATQHVLEHATLPVLMSH